MHVVILGGGFCGAFTAKKLDKYPQIETTLVDNKRYYEYAPSLHKVIHKPELLLKLRVPYHNFLKNTTIIRDTVEQVDTEKVYTTNQEISYDILVISMGISYPIFLENTAHVFKLKNGKDVQAIIKQIHQANHLLIVGGGKIGVEIAGEIVTKFPEKTLTVVHSKKRLLERNNDDASTFAQKFLEKHGADILLTEKVIQHNGSSYITNTGRKIHADLTFWCAGIQWKTSYMSKFPDTIFSPRHQLRVTSSLQLQGFPNIFVGGDLTDIQEEKTGRKAELHARVIATNIRRLVTGKPLINYKQGTSPIVISLGDWYGILEYRKTIPSRFSIGLLKKAIEWWTLHQLH